MLQKMFNANSKKHVLGIDRTFNIGCIYATCCVFQLQGLRSRRTKAGGPALIMGPIFLHWDGSKKTYKRFFNYLKEELGPIENVEVGHSLVFGSDEEKALLKAIAEVFDKSESTLCTKHLKDNFKRLCRTNAIAPKIESKLKHAIFEKLCDSKDGHEFDHVALSIKSDVDQHAKVISEHVDGLITKILDYVWKPSKNGNVGLGWTNNACESFNHILKSVTQWKSLRMLDLIKRFEQISLVQQKDMMRAIFGEGNFRLGFGFTDMCISNLEFNQEWSEKARNRHFSKLIIRLTGYKKPKDQYIKSNDEKLVIQNSQKNIRKARSKGFINNNQNIQKILI